MTQLLPTSEAVELQEHAALIDRETHLAHRGVELAADAFASAATEFARASVRLAAVNAYVLAFRVPEGR